VPPKILDRHCKIGPSTDHRAKFHASRPTHLGDLALNEKTSGLKLKSAPQAIASGRTKKSYAADYQTRRALMPHIQHTPLQNLATTDKKLKTKSVVNTTFSLFATAAAICNKHVTVNIISTNWCTKMAYACRKNITVKATICCTESNISAKTML